MSHGGRRVGAGRKPGSVNKFNRALLEVAEATGALPVNYLLSVMRDESNPTSTRIDAAKSVAPYLHHRLASQSISMAPTESSFEDWVMKLS